jgi:hypothetical protein
MVYKWMQKKGVSDESVREALRNASRNLCDRWVSENAVRETIQKVPKEPYLGQAEARDPRDVISCDDIPLY